MCIEVSASCNIQNVFKLTAPHAPFHVLLMSVQALKNVEIVGKVNTPEVLIWNELSAGDAVG